MPKHVTNTKSNLIDAHVGAQMRARRKSLGISQSGLAEALDITFQQVQKYERGTNRVSVATLFAAARFLEVPVPFFFDGFEDPAPGDDVSAYSSEQAAHDFLATDEGLELAQHFPRVPGLKLRRRIAELVKILAGEVVEA